MSTLKQLKAEIEMLKVEHKKLLLEEQIETLYWKKRAISAEGDLKKEQSVSRIGFEMEEEED